MIIDEMQDALIALGARPPHRRYPLAPDGSNPALSEETWTAYRWNFPAPPTGLPDPVASPKPTWAELESSLAQVRLRRARARVASSSQMQEQGRICQAYIGDQNVAQTVQQETLYRLRAMEFGTDITAKHAERDRLHTRAVALKAWTEHEDRTLTEIEDFDPADDSHWRATPPPA